MAPGGKAARAWGYPLTSPSSVHN